MQTTGLNHLLVTLFPLAFDLLDLGIGGVVQLGDFGFPVAAEYDVGTPTGHVGGNGYRARSAGLSDDFRFLLVVLGVEHLVVYARFFQAAGHFFRRLDGCGADQNRGLLRLVFFDVFNNCVVLFLDREIHQII